MMYVEFIPEGSLTAYKVGLRLTPNDVLLITSIHENGKFLYEKEFKELKDDTTFQHMVMQEVEK